SGRLKISLLNKLIKQKQFSKKIHVYLDEKLECQDELYLVDELSKDAYLIDINQLQELSNQELIGISFSEEIGQSMESRDKISFKERVKALHSLPPMPETASEILKLRSIPDVKVEQIVTVIEKDPVLVAQIIKYANSAYFGQAGSVKSLKDAIFRVLGVDAVMNMALALSVGSSFKIPTAGPIGAKSVWKSSIYTASLMQRLSMLMPWGQRPNPGTAYLIGLLHDFGLLVLGHLFADEYLSLNKYLEMNAEVNIVRAEESMLGISHLEIGKIVMRMWNMPVELIEVAKNERNSAYSGEYNTYIQLLTVVKSILAPHGLVYGDALTELPQNVLELLSLEEEDVIIAADEVLQAGEIMNDLVKQMCA
ncbi:MAG: HDOD domain-containing protein, partial [Gammaproteobacteria bacterium]|nr:HDOD domain-containing protein [Gammaproteobacteria bacterium]